MIKRATLFKIIFLIAGSAILVFIFLPLASTLFSTSPDDIASALTSDQVMSSLLTTFWAGLIAVVIGLLGGVPLAYLLSRCRFPGKRLVEGLVELPIVIPHTAAGIALLMVFGSRGVLGQIFERLGIYFVDSLPGIVVGMIFVSIPFLVNMSREAFSGIDQELELAALVDGASPWQCFFKVTLPIAWRGVMAGAMMMWARGISEFGAVIILAYRPTIIPTLIFQFFQGYGLNTAKPVAVVLIAAVLIVFIILRMILLPDEDR